MEPARPERGSNSQRNKARGKGSRSQRKQEQAGGLCLLFQVTQKTQHMTLRILFYFLREYLFR